MNSRSRAKARGPSGAGARARAKSGSLLLRQLAELRLRLSGRRLLINLLLLLAAALTLFPLAWMLSVSLMTPGEASTFPPPLLPAHATLINYRTLFAQAGIGRYFANSVLLAVAATALSLLFNVGAGYAFAKLHFRGRERIFKLLLGTLVIPGQVAMLPLFLLLKHLGLVNSYIGVLVPACASIFGIFLVRQYALTIPDALLEAARLDGASELRIFRSIVLPLLSPILVTLSIFTFLGSWNDFMWPLIVLTDTDLYTLPVALASLSREHVQDNEMMMAGSVLTIFPVLLLFLGLQRYYIQGLLMGGVKG
jgi:multiple sugar transport system permease protein